MIVRNPVAHVSAIMEVRMKHEIMKVESYDPKRIFECVICDRRGYVSPKGVRRRYCVVMRSPEGTEDVYCLVCARRLSGLKQTEIMKMAE